MQLYILITCIEVTLLFQISNNLSGSGEGGKPHIERADSVFGLGDILEHEAEEETDEGDLEDELTVTPGPDNESVVSVKSGSFTWSAESGKTNLTISSINIPSGQLKSYNFTRIIY